jgi:hypothetical protein
MRRTKRAFPGPGLWILPFVLVGMMTPALALAQTGVESGETATGSSMQPLAVQPRLPEGARDAEASVDPTQEPRTETFQFPVYDDFRLNFCLMPAEGQCGQPTAEKWCREKGFTRVASWKRDPNVGSLFPTIFLDTKAVCDNFVCDGFEEITCAR